MMARWTLGLYFGLSFLRQVLLVFGLFLALIIVVDTIELSRDLARSQEATLADVVLIALYRAPRFAEGIFPFAILFGAATTLLLLNRRLELVVARASGVSIWQFLAPLMIVAIILGAFSTFIYNPLALVGLSQAKKLEASAFGNANGGLVTREENFWLRLNQRDGDLVIRAGVALGGGQDLAAASFYRFQADGSVLDRIDATRALFLTTQEGQSVYRLTNAKITIPGQRSTQREQVDVPVNITLEQLQSRTTDVASLGFWQLGRDSIRAQEAGRSPLPYKTYRQALLSRSLLFVAMVLLAATVSLTFSRFGQNGRLLLAGICAGFVLYVLSRLVITFGSNGLVPPGLAAWTPALLGTLIGATVLLYQEDG